MGRHFIEIEELRDIHRAWLGKHGLLDRPWFILASGPNPTVPPGMLDNARLVCINNAPATAKRIGLGSPHLTLRNPDKEWKSVRGCKLPLILWMSNKADWAIHWARLVTAGGIAGEIRALRKNLRDDITLTLLGSELEAVGKLHKPSTGIFAIIYGLFVGVPEITFGGVTMDKDGYSYGSLPGIQRHRDEDIVTMQLIARRYPNVRTTEAQVSERTGIPLYQSSGN
jgi:hypothetical protein